jgi:hypothetical protein
MKKMVIGVIMMEVMIIPVVAGVVMMEMIFQRILRVKETLRVMTYPFITTILLIQPKQIETVLQIGILPIMIERLFKILRNGYRRR